MTLKVSSIMGRRVVGPSGVYASVFCQLSGSHTMQGSEPGYHPAKLETRRLVAAIPPEAGAREPNLGQEPQSLVHTVLHSTQVLLSAHPDIILNCKTVFTPHCGRSLALYTDPRATAG